MTDSRKLSGEGVGFNVEIPSPQRTPEIRRETVIIREEPDYKALLRRESIKEEALVENPEDRPIRRKARLEKLDRDKQAAIKETLNRKLSLAFIRVRFIARLCVLARKSMLEDDYFRPLNRRRFHFIDPGTLLCCINIIY